MGYFSEKSAEIEETNNLYAKSLGYHSYEQMISFIAYEEDMINSGEHPELQYQ